MSLSAANVPPPPRTVEPVPETRQATRSLWRWLAILVTCALGSWGAWYLAEVAIKHRAWDQLLLEGTVSKAELISLDLEGTGQAGKKRHRLGYRFPTSTGDHEATSYTWPTPNLPRLGDTFSVSYLPAQPYTHVMGDLTQGEARLLESSFHYEYDQVVGFLGVLCFVAIALALVIGFFLVWMLIARWRATRREELLARDGIAHDAQITSSEPDATVPTLYKVAYSFQPSDGPVITGSTFIQQATVEAEGYRVGASLPVLYDRTKPACHILMRDLAYVTLTTIA